MLTVAGVAVNLLSVVAVSPTNLTVKKYRSAILDYSISALSVFFSCPVSHSRSYKLPVFHP